MKAFAVVVILLSICVAASADVTVMERVSDTGHHDIGLTTEWGEICVFDFGKADAMIEIGKLVKSGDTLVGGYLSYWNGPKELYAEPFMLAVKDNGDMRLKAKLYAYLPLNGGKSVFASDEISLTCKVSQNVRIGAVARFWKADGEDLLVGKGWQVEWCPDEKTSITLRKMDGDLAQARLAIFRTF